MGRRLACSRGTVLAALMVMIVVMAVLSSTAYVQMSTLSRRERELELRFRGNQFILGIQEYQERHNAAPTNFKQMVESRPPTLRRCWDEPMTARYGQDGELVEGGKWVVIPFGAPPPQPPRGTGLGADGRDQDDDDDDDDDRTPGTQAVPEEELGDCEKVMTRPLVGVKSPSSEKALTSYREWKAEEPLSNWEFKVLGQDAVGWKISGGSDPPLIPGFAGMRAPGGPPIKPSGQQPGLPPGTPPGGGNLPGTGAGSSAPLAGTGPKGKPPSLPK